MGSWGTGIFDDDIAQDWLGDFEADPVGAVTAAFDAVQSEPAGTYLEMDVVVAALAAGEALATALGRPAAGLSDDVAQTLNAQAAAVAAAGLDPVQAAQVVERAGGPDSEKGERETWFQEADHAAFLAAVAELRARLAMEPATG
ncbi:MAG: DUF4259 domain-containing protein [Pseudomonadota bacterium]